MSQQNLLVHPAESATCSCPKTAIGLCRVGVVLPGDDEAQRSDLWFEPEVGFEPTTFRLRVGPYPPRIIVAGQVRDLFHLVPSRSGW